MVLIVVILLCYRRNYRRWSVHSSAPIPQVDPGLLWSSGLLLKAALNPYMFTSSQATLLLWWQWTFPNPQSYCPVLLLSSAQSSWRLRLALIWVIVHPFWAPPAGKLGHKSVLSSDHTRPYSSVWYSTT